MTKRKTKSKRSLASLPKGLPSKRTDVNPFEVTKRQSRAKHDVNNRFRTDEKKPSKLAESLQRRHAQLRATLQSSKKVNSFVDRRIGEYTMSQDDKLLARLVKERSGRSKRASKYSLDDDDQNKLTHKGKSIDQMSHVNHVMLDSDDEDGGNLDAMDTEMNFGGDGPGEFNPYGPSGGERDMSQVYSQRKTDLDDMIKRRKIMKAEKMMSKEKQEETFESLDEGFQELSQLLQFRDKETERKLHLEKKRAGQLTEEDKEMAEWDKEMKTYLYERKVKATDRTRTPEEIAKQEADQLHEQETKRLARMNGDFEHDELSDISDNEEDTRRNKKRKKKKSVSNKGPEALDDSDDEEEKDDFKVKFTADGLVYIDKDGKVVKKVGEDDEDEQGGSEEDEDEESDTDEDSDDDERHDPDIVLDVGAVIKGNYRANEQFGDQQAWHDGKIVKVHTDKAGNVTYDVEYVDGDFEDAVETATVRPVKKTSKEKVKEQKKKEQVLAIKRKRRKAKDEARYVPRNPTIMVLKQPFYLRDMGPTTTVNISTGELPSVLLGTSLALFADT